MVDQREIFLAIDRREMEVQQLFVQYPSMSRYFYKRQPLPAKHPSDGEERARVYAFCEILLRQFDFIARFADRSQTKPEDIWRPYIKRIEYIFGNSSVLVDFYLKHKDHYSDALARYVP